VTQYPVRRRRESGVALMAVLLVLMALVAIALPFSLSMRNQERSATVAVYQAKAQASVEAVLRLAEEELSLTDSTRDATPHYDSPEELSVQLSAAAGRYAEDANDPAGTIWSARTGDEQGRVDLNQSSPFLLGNLLGGYRLAGGLDAGSEAELRLADSSGLPEQGIVWVDGELILYRSLNDRVLSGLSRAFNTSLVRSLPAREHRDRAAVIDYRVLVAALYPYKIRPGDWQGYATVTALKDISSLGEVAFTSDEIEGLWDDLTTWAVLPGSGRFLGAARLLLDADPSSAEQELFVNYGRNFGPGTVVRIHDEHRLEYNLVVSAEPAGEGFFRLLLQEPLQNGYRADEALVEALARAPVDINGCSRRVLEALLSGVRLSGSTERVEAGEAALVADALLQARPIKGLPDLAAVLKSLSENEVIGDDDRRALLLNAEHAGDALLAFGTAPFAYRSYGVFRIDAAASENLPVVPGSTQGGREQARLFARQISQVFAPGEQIDLLSSQLDFEEAIRLSRTGKFWTTFPENLLDLDDLNQPPSRVAAALNGRFAAQAGTQEPYLRLAPSRKQGGRDQTAWIGDVERVLHFDGSGPEEYRSNDIDGWNVADQGPLALPVDSDLVGLLTDRGWARPFCFEMWWRPQDSAVGTETILFDCGYQGDQEQVEVTNRIFATFDGERLSFRVADASIPDLVGQTFPGAATDLKPGDYPQQFAQIQYAFDDGLAFGEDVAYHLTFYARGTKPTDLLLLVDGVPRGRRAFQTRVREELHAPAGAGPFANIPGYTAGQSTKIAVEDARLLPPFGVVRIDQELIEYTDRNDRELIVSRAGGDAFGGRAKRGSSGDRHLETEAVELYGYTGVLMSERVPNGPNIGMRNPLGRFGVAMVDPELKQTVEIRAVIDNPQPDGPRDIRIGVGIDSTAAELPLVGLGDPNGTNPGGSAAAGIMNLAELFDQNGGFALIVSCPRPPPSNGGDDRLTVGEAEARFTWIRTLRTPNGELIGLGELIKYTSYDGGTLRGVTRAPGSTRNSRWVPAPSNLMVAGEQATTDAARTGTDAHAHVMTWDNNWVEDGYAQRQPVFVLPVSVKPGLGQQALNKSFAVPVKQGIYTLPEMAQIGTGFSGAATGGGTEWIRYDVTSDGCLVRDNPLRIQNTVDLLARDLTVNYTRESPGKLPDLQAVFEAVNFEEIAGTREDKQQLARDAGIPATRLDGGVLAFRGVLGTETKDHPAQARALPVIRTYRNDVMAARPGARDFVTLVDPVSESREGHRVNYGYCESDVEGWGGAACHLAFDSGVLGEYQENLRNLFSAVDPESSSAGMAALMNANIQSRELTRILKFPSGELPSALGEELHLGGDMYGEAAPGGGVIDELEFFNPQTPSDVLPRHARYMLSRDDDFKGTLYVDREALRYNLWTILGSAVEAIDPVANLPKDGCVLLIDEELIAIDQIRIEADRREAELEIAVNGRGYLGTPIQFHTRSAPVREMTFLRVSRLEKSISETAREIPVADASDFPTHGVVQIGRELIGYVRKEGQLLVMPDYLDPRLNTRVGLFRGRYGTRPESHAQGTLVYVFPYRFEDRYQERADDPELAWVGVFLKARGGFYQELSWTADQTSELVDLVVAARVGGRGRFSDDPEEVPDLFLFTTPGGTQTDRNELLRQGDDLELRIFTRYLDGAFDSAAFEPDPGSHRGGSNEWKRAPRLKALGVQWIAGPHRLAYEEWR